MNDSLEQQVKLRVERLENDLTTTVTEINVLRSKLEEADMTIDVRLEIMRFGT